MCRNLEYSERLREKEKVGGMPAKLNEKKSNRQLERSLRSRRKKSSTPYPFRRLLRRLLEREIKDKGDIFLLEEQRENFVTAVEKIRDASGHQGKNERQSKNEQEHVRSFPP